MDLKWAVAEQFHEYLYGNIFNAHPDNNPLNYIITTAKLDATHHHWIANYNFRLHYKFRNTNGEADALSRIPWNRVINQETIKSLIANAVIKSNAVVEAYV